MQATNIVARHFRELLRHHFITLILLAVALGCASIARATPPQVLVISTAKPLGPALGTFSTTGAFNDVGTLVTVERRVSALPAPFGVVTHLVLRMEGQYGTFTIRTQIKESLTHDPSVFANEGSWAVVSGTGAYAVLRGSGSMEGTVNDAANLITRVYSGRAHFD